MRISVYSMKVVNGLSAVFIGTAAMTLVQPALALNASQVASIAEQISVRIDGQAPGSGVLVAKQGQNYFVLTAAHVVATDDEYKVVTPDNQHYSLVYNQVKKLPGVDLAIVQFSSAKSYQVAKLGNSSQSQRGMTSYVAGWPLAGVAITQPTLLFQQGIISANSQVQQDDGYGLIYTNNTLPGMSGGPVLSEEGALIGIHGRGEVDRQASTGDPDIVVKVGYNLGIPISTFLVLAPQSGLSLEGPASTPSSPSGSSVVDDLIAESGNKLHQGNYSEAFAVLSRAIEADPKAADAYRLRADARMSTMGWSFIEGRSSKNKETVLAALKDINESIRLSPTLSESFAIRSYLRFVLKDESGSIADINESLRLNPKSATPYILRANIAVEKLQWQQAIADANQALQLDPNSPYAAFAYNARGLGFSYSGDATRGIQDLTEAIKLAPGNPFFYLNRGILQAYGGNPQGGITDLETSASLAKQKGNTEVYQATLDNLALIRQLVP